MQPLLPEPKKTPLKDMIINRLSEQHITPRSRWFFRSRECVVWFFWFISIVIGSVAMAVMLFSLRYQQYALYEATHATVLTFIVSALPYVWLVAFGVLLAVALFNLRHTKRGYRYSVLFVLGSSAALSLLGGVLLHWSGYGYLFDRYLGEQIAMYDSQIKREQDLWQQPADGRLLGQLVHTTQATSSTIVFGDYLGGRWRVDITELTPEEIALLDSKVLVRMFGEPVNLPARIFRACGVFPWLLHAAPDTERMKKDRLSFLDKSMSHAELAEERLEQRTIQLLLDKELATSTSRAACANMAPVKRVKEKMDKSY